jgi:hypothetical protein
MKTDRNGRRPVGSALNLGARSAQRPKAHNLISMHLEVDRPPGNAEGDRGNDPYNTSGSFDRKKNWARVGKR